MRLLSSIATLALFLGGTQLAGAQRAESSTGSFASTFEIVVDNCEDMGLKLDKGDVVVSRNGRLMSVSIPSLPKLQGRSGRKGKLRAEARGATKTTGITARYGLNGRISGMKMQAVLVAEYYKGTKPQCTQSWSVAGKRTKL